jgi:hypothetical protein
MMGAEEIRGSGERKRTHTNPYWATDRAGLRLVLAPHGKSSKSAASVKAGAPVVSEMAIYRQRMNYFWAVSAKPLYRRV